MSFTVFNLRPIFSSTLDIFTHFGAFLSVYNISDNFVLSFCTTVFFIGSYPFVDSSYQPFYFATPARVRYRARYMLHWIFFAEFVEFVTS